MWTQTNKQITGNHQFHDDMEELTIENIESEEPLKGERQSPPQRTEDGHYLQEAGQISMQHLHQNSSASYVNIHKIDLQALFDQSVVQGLKQDSQSESIEIQQKQDPSFFECNLSAIQEMNVPPQDISMGMTTIQHLKMERKKPVYYSSMRKIKVTRMDVNSSKDNIVNQYQQQKEKLLKQQQLLLRRCNNLAFFQVLICLYVMILVLASMQARDISQFLGESFYTNKDSDIRLFIAIFGNSVALITEFLSYRQNKKNFFKNLFKKLILYFQFFLDLILITGLVLIIIEQLNSVIRQMIIIIFFRAIKSYYTFRLYQSNMNRG